METISLMGNTGLQFIDVSISLSENSPAMKVKQEFAEISFTNEGDMEERSLVFPKLSDSGKYIDPETGENVAEHNMYYISARQAITCFEGRWIPLPYFRRSSYEAAFHEGPTTWARMWLNPAPGFSGKQNTGASREETGHTHNLVLAFDTRCLKDADEFYLAPTDDDKKAGSIFMAAVEPEDSMSLIATDWVQMWLEKEYENRRDEVGLSYMELHFAHIGLYLTLLKTIEQAKGFPPVSLHTSDLTIESDLILDVGNSRSCGLLLETARTGDSASFTDCSRLEIRDLTLPDRIYTEPFEMRTEFVQAEFGMPAAAKLAGRKQGFRWPSLVRIGQEASRRAVLNDSEDYTTGMSSPKRYLWDKEKSQLPWMFNSSRKTHHIPDPALNDFSSLFTEDGRLIRKETDIPGLNPHYSRSSVMTFALVEIILHALCQINSFRFRKHHGQTRIPRKLKRVVLTCPTAMLVTEKKTLRQQAQSAILSLKSYFGDNFLDEDVEVIPCPSDVAKGEGAREWGYDEATCVQLMYLYGEIRHRYRNDTNLYFRTNGRMREDLPIPEQPGVTVASFDIGGGTSDLMVISYQHDPNANTSVLTPYPLFWEGFNLAGDEILKRVIERIVLPAIRARAEASGCKNPADIMIMMFGPDYGGQSALDRARRKQFAVQVAQPVGLSMLQHAAESAPLVNRPFSDFFVRFPAPHRELISYVNQRFEDNGAKGFRLEEMEWTLNTKEINNVISDVLKDIVKSLCGVIYQFDCDYLLLAGRPTVLPVVRDIFLNFLPLPPDRIVLMGRYRMGNWYPFADPGGRIYDPKTCVCVGAAVALMAGTLGRLEGFRLNTGYLRSRITSTANYIGSYNSNTSTLRQVFFQKDEADEAFFQFDGPMFLGMRQMNSEEWLAQPMYKVEYAGLEAARELVSRLPLTIGVRRSQQDKETLVTSEDCAPMSVTDKDGKPVSTNLIRITPQTLVDDNGHWLDTGSFLVSKF